MNFQFTQVDVFTHEALKGNPLAVVHGADALSEAQMQAFAEWTHLSETTFLLKPTDPAADYRVRIFTPGGELPFAGHPTLGTCHAWLAAGGKPRARDMVVQQCAVGLVRVRQSEGGLAAFAAPPLRMSEVDDELVSKVLGALGLQRHQLQASQWLQNGPAWLTLLLDRAETVLAIEPDSAALRTLADVGVVAPYAAGHAFQFELRAFTRPFGTEDPVTGSLNAGVAQWLMGKGLAPSRYLASQGTRLKRAGRILIEQEGGTLWVGGHSVICIHGEVEL